MFWNECAAKRIVELVGEDDIEVRLVWSGLTFRVRRRILIR